MTISNREEQTTALSVKPERFLKKINELKEFSENIPEQSNLPTFKEAEGLFKWFKQDIKVSDINDLTEKIQDKMIHQNKVLLRTIQEFKNVYETFSILNKEYILKIVASVKAAEEANRKAVYGINEIQKSNVEIQKNQMNIDLLVGQQELVINSLKNFKQELETLKHLKNIDAMFETLSHLQMGLNGIDATVNTHQQQLKTLSEDTNELQVIVALYKKNLEELKNSIQVQIQSVEDKVAQQESLLMQLQTTSVKSVTTINLLVTEFEDHKQSFSNYKEDIAVDFEKLNTTMDSHVQEFAESIATIVAEFQAFKNQGEQDKEALHKKIEDENKNKTVYFEKEFSKHEKEIADLNQLVGNLSKNLKMTKIISYSGIGILLILIILLISGVL